MNRPTSIHQRCPQPSAILTLASLLSCSRAWAMDRPYYYTFETKTRSLSYLKLIHYFLLLTRINVPHIKGLVMLTSTRTLKKERQPTPSLSAFTEITLLMDEPIINPISRVIAACGILCIWTQNGSYVKCISCADKFPSNSCKFTRFLSNDHDLYFRTCPYPQDAETPPKSYYHPCFLKLSNHLVSKLWTKLIEKPHC